MIATHSITLEEIRPGRWRAVCSCGQYKSSGYAYKGHAEAAGAQHIRSRTRGATA